MTAKSTSHTAPEGWSLSLAHSLSFTVFATCCYQGLSAEVHGWHFGRAEHPVKDAFLLFFSSRIKTDISEIVILCLLFTVAVKSKIIIPLQN